MTDACEVCGEGPIDWACNACAEEAGFVAGTHATVDAIVFYLRKSLAEEAKIVGLRDSPVLRAAQRTMELMADGIERGEWRAKP